MKAFNRCFMLTQNRQYTLHLLLLVIGLLTSVNSYAQITAIGQCAGVTTNEEYTILVDNLPSETYEIIVDGVSEATGVTSTSYTTNSLTFVDGKTKVTIDVVNSLLDTSSFIVNEVLCIDIDGDGSLDFNKAECDYTKPIGTSGTIISTVAPFNGNNVYLYILVGSDSIYNSATSSANNSGLFTDLDDGDYNVHAFNFLSETEASDFLDSIPDGTNLGTYSAAAPACYMHCGDASYTVDCPSIVVVVDPNDVTVCAHDSTAFITSASYSETPPDNDSLIYTWQVLPEGSSVWTTVTDASTADTIYSIGDVMFADSGNMYRVIVTMTVNNVTISMDTSGVATLNVNDTPFLASNLSVDALDSNEDIGIILTVGSGSIPATSFDIVNIDIGGLTAGAGNVGTGVTTDSSYIESDTYENSGSEPDTAWYTIVPISSESCHGDTVLVYVEILPCAYVSDFTPFEVCSDDEFTSIVLPTQDDNGYDIDSLVITASAGSNLTPSNASTPSEGVTQSTTYLQGDAYTNTSASEDTVTYSIVPYANGCEGDPFTIKVAVTPEPVGTDPLPEICSDEMLSIDLTNHITNGGATPSFTWYAISNANVDGEDTTAQTTNIISDQLSNTSTSAETVEYKVIPTATGTCIGDTFSITVTVLPEPLADDEVVEACSDETLDIILTDNITNSVGILGFTYTVLSSNQDSVPAGAARTDTTSANITDSYTNTTSGDVLISYTVTPISSDSCAGASFDIDVTIHPEPVSIPDNALVCSDEALDIDLSSSITNGVSILGYVYTVSSSDQTNVPAGTARTDTTASNITDSYTNATSSSVDITYTVTPITTDSCAGDDFIVTVTVEPEPEADNETETVCSDEALDIVLTDNITNSVGIQGFLYTVSSADETNVPAGAARTDTSSSNITDTYTNTTSNSVDITYTITPVSTAGCVGEDFTVTVTVDPEPEADNETETVCSDEALDIVLTDNITNSVGIQGFVYYVTSSDTASVSPGASRTDTSNTNITDSYSNTSSSSVTIIYTVTPISTDGCAGSDFTVTVTVDPEPEADNETDAVCSDEALDISITDNITNGVSVQGFVYTVTSSDDTNVPAGSARTDTTSSNITDTYTNSTSSSVDITYTITPISTNGCAGSDFTVTVTVDPEPEADNETETVCSDEALDIILTDNITNSVGIQGFLYTVTSSNQDSVAAGSARTDTTSSNITDTYTNTSSISVDITYTVTPISTAGCVGEDFTVIVTVDPEPEADNETETVCSDEALDVDLTDNITNGVSVQGFVYTVTSSDDTNVPAGSARTDTSSSNITDSYTNTTSSSVTITYTVTPVSTNGCAGENFTLTVTVDPEPVADNETEAVCSDEALNIDLTDNVTNSVSVQGFVYTVTSSDDTNVPAGSARTDTTSSNITDTYTNETSSSVTITYTVTPISTSGCAGTDFTVTVTIEPEPEADKETATVCSDTVLDISLTDNITNGQTTQGFIYTVSSSDGGSVAAGPARTDTTNANITDTYVNTSSDSVLITYTVTPIGSGGCVGDTFTVVVQVDPKAVVSTDGDVTVCSTEDVDLTGGSITGGTTSGTWSSDGTGTFEDASEGSSTAYGTAVSYVPSDTDKENGTVTITLTTDDPTGLCPSISESFEVEILDVSCSTFPWDGND